MMSSMKIILVFAAFLVLTFISGSNAQCGLAGYGQNAVRFNGATPYPYVLLDSSLTANNLYDTLLNFTIQGWIYLTPGNPSSNIRTIVVKAPRTNNGDNTYSNALQNKQEFSLEVTAANNLRFRMGCDLNYGFDIMTAGVLPTGIWTNVAVAMNYARSTASLYVNGALQTLSNGAVVGNWSNSCISLGVLGPYRSPFYPGGANVPRVTGGKIQVGLYSIQFATSPNRFIGLVDELSIWNTVLTDAQITANTANGLRGDETGLVSYHSFNEGSGTAAYSPFPTNGDFRFAPASTPVIPGYLYNNVQWTPSSLQLDYPLIGIPYTTNQATALPLYAVESPNRTQGVLYFNITSLPINGYLTGYPSVSPRGSLSNVSRTEVTLQLYDILQNNTGSAPVVRYHSRANYLGEDSFTYSTFALESSGYVSCSATGPNSGARVYLMSICAYLDKCGVCNGDNSTCTNTPIYGNGTCCIDECGVPGGDGSSCAGCDGVPNSGTVYDDCSVCGGNNTECADCDGIPNGPNPPNSCGCCLDGLNFTCPDGESDPNYCLDCFGCPFGTAVEDECGECGGNGTSCLGCDNTVNGPSADLCGVCRDSADAIFSSDSTCGTPQCDNIPNVFPDECGVCGGDNSTCQCVFYKNYQIAKMDCVLIDFTLNHTLCIIDELVAELELSLQYFENNNSTRYFDNQLVQNELLALTRFVRGSAIEGDESNACVNDFCSQLSSAINRISQLVQY